MLFRALKVSWATCGQSKKILSGISVLKYRAFCIRVCITQITIKFCREPYRHFFSVADCVRRGWHANCLGTVCSLGKLRGRIPKSVPLDFALDKTFALYFYHQCRDQPNATTRHVLILHVTITRDAWLPRPRSAMWEVKNQLLCPVG